MFFQTAKCVFHRVFFGFACVLLIASCAGGPRWNSQVYRVYQNDTLYAIAWRYGLDYHELARWNNIKPPYVIHPGQELILVDPATLPESRRPAADSELASATPQTNRTPKDVNNKVVIADPPKKFVWPASGKVITTFAGSKSVARGIDIQANVGDSVVAAADGKVVYSGSGLTGYGKLLIVKHNDSFLSAYAHNNKLLVNEGETVKSGQQIAEIGHDSEKRAVLHFEIRQQGKPVDPLKYLPKR